MWVQCVALVLSKALGVLQSAPLRLNQTLTSIYVSTKDVAAKLKNAAIILSDTC